MVVKIGSVLRLLTAEARHRWDRQTEMQSQ